MSRDGLRILVLGLNYVPEPTGIAPYTAGMARGLRAHGHEVRVLTTFAHYPQWRFLEGDGGWTRRERLDDLCVTRLRHYVPSTPRLTRRAVSEISFGARVLAARWEDPDVVVCVSPALLSSAMAVARVRTGRRRAAVGLVMQDLYAPGLTETGAAGPGSRLVGRLERLTARGCDGVAVIHDRLGARVQAVTGLTEDRVRVIRNWTHVEQPAAFDRAEVRRRLGWEVDETIVLHTGAMGEKQALGNVVAAGRLADAQAAPVRFVLMGDGGQRRLLESEADGVTRLDFVDPVAADDYAAVLRSADLLLLNERPGVQEMALPSKLTSYFSTGLPVLAVTDPAGTAAQEVLASGAGVLVEPGRPDLLLAAAQRLRDQPTRAAELGARGPSYCAAVLSEAVALRSYDSWVRDLARLRRGDHA